MPFKIPNAVQETSTTTGTGTLTLAGAVASRNAFSSQMSNGDTTIYVIEDGTDWEVGYGTYTNTSGQQLARNTVVWSTNGNALVNWAAGTRNVYVSAFGELLASMVDPSMANGLLEKTGDRTYASNTVTAFAKTLLDDADAATAKVTLGLTAPTIQVFTASGIWTRPAGCRKVVVEVIGGGGGGGGAANPGNDEYSGGGGGSSGGYTKAVLNVSAIASSTITIGAGGAGGVAGSSGAAGAPSSWNDTVNVVSANGGSGGAVIGPVSNGFTRTTNITVGATKTTGGWSVEEPGGHGGRVMLHAGTATAALALGGPGGASYLGPGGLASGASTSSQTDGSDAVTHGGGGGGAVAYQISGGTGNAANGGAGKEGIVIVTEFY